MSYKQSNNAQIRAQPGQRPRDNLGGDFLWFPGLLPAEPHIHLLDRWLEAKEQSFVERVHLCSVPGLCPGPPASLRDREQGRRRWGLSAATESTHPRAGFALRSDFQIHANMSALAPAPPGTPLPSQGQTHVVRWSNKTVYREQNPKQTTATAWMAPPDIMWGRRGRSAETQTVWSQQAGLSCWGGAQMSGSGNPGGKREGTG